MREGTTERLFIIKLNGCSYPQKANLKLRGSLQLGKNPYVFELVLY